MLRKLIFVALLAGSAALAADDLEKNFVSPPQEARPWVLWWFHGGYGSPEGMAGDIAAMKEKGIGGVLHMQTRNMSGLPLPAEPKMLGPEWQAWFGEMLRLSKEGGMTLSASIVDGWAHGGWWVGPEDGAKQLVYSETQVDGPATLADPLPQPAARLKVYRDVAVVAFKEDATRPPMPAQVKANNVFRGFDKEDRWPEENWPAIHVADGDPLTFWRTNPKQPIASDSPAVLDFEYAQPLAAGSIFIAAMPEAGLAEAELQVSDDGKAYRAVTSLSMKPGERRTISFPQTAARHFRLVISRAHADDLQLAEVSLLREDDRPVLRPGIKNWEFKSANRTWWGFPADPYEGLEEAYDAPDVCDVHSAEVLDLTSRLQPDGTLDWQAPAGRWTILRFGWTPLGEPAGAGSGGWEVDVLNTKGADLMMDKAGRLMWELSVKHAGGTPILFHTGSSEFGSKTKGFQPTWTEDFREQFQKRRGYDLLRYLPAMARRVVDGREISNRFLQDYRDTVADLLADYYGHLQKRAHEMNGGINSESGYGSFHHPQMDALRVFGRADRPYGEIWHAGTYRRQMQQHVDIMRTTASGARIYGNRYVQAETLTWQHLAPLFTAPAAYRGTLHSAWAGGLNQAVIHKYSHQPMEAKPGLMNYDIFNRHFSWWPLADGFIGYMGRCQSLLQRGEFVADVAYFVGEGAMRFVPAKDFLNPALPNGYDYDGINAEVLMTRASVEDGRLILPGGLRYRYLVLCDPQNTTMRPATLGRIRELVEAGVTLVGKRPLRTPGLGDMAQAEARLKSDADALWGTAPGEQGERNVGKGRVIWGRELAEIMRADGLAPDCEWQAEGGAARYPVTWLHRREGSGDIYFVANPMGQPVVAQLKLRARGNRVRLFDPLAGSARTLPETQRLDDGRLSVPMRFEPQQAFFLVIDIGESGAASVTAKNFPELKAVQDITGPWQVAFDAAWVKPAVETADHGRLTIDFDALTDWTQRPEDGIRHYSGIAVYRRTFEMPTGTDAVYLELGVVNDMARVEINGRDLGVAWCPPYRVHIPAGLLKEQGNELVITVANSWNNRLYADHSLPEEQRLTRAESRAYQTAARHGMLPSGLLGPVRVLQVKDH